MSVDPKVMQTGQPYVFTGDDPLNRTDPLGLMFSSRSGSSGVGRLLAYALKRGGWCKGCRIPVGSVAQAGRGAIYQGGGYFNVTVSNTVVAVMQGAPKLGISPTKAVQLATLTLCEKRAPGTSAGGCENTYLPQGDFGSNDSSIDWAISQAHISRIPSCLTWGLGSFGPDLIDPSSYMYVGEDLAAIDGVADAIKQSINPVSGTC